MKRVRQVLEKLDVDVAGSGRVGGKSVKTNQGAGDTFHRLRVGDHRVMYDVIEDEHVILIHGIVHRSELERWIRNR
jgi:mRNA-degrading endonuclease RelE of RelBE toxin-antitoxin system